MGDGEVLIFVGGARKTFWNTNDLLFFCFLFHVSAFTLHYTCGLRRGKKCTPWKHKVLFGTALTHRNRLSCNVQLPKGGMFVHGSSCGFHWIQWSINTKSTVDCTTSEGYDEALPLLDSKSVFWEEQELLNFTLR